MPPANRAILTRLMQLFGKIAEQHQVRLALCCDCLLSLPQRHSYLPRGGRLLWCGVVWRCVAICYVVFNSISKLTCISNITPDQQNERPQHCNCNDAIVATTRGRDNRNPRSLWTTLTAACCYSYRGVHCFVYGMPPSHSSLSIGCD